MSKLIIGIWINILMSIYIVIGFCAVYVNSVLLSIIYLILCFFSILSLVYVQCCDCPRRNLNCTHIWFGKITTLLKWKKGPPSKSTYYLGLSIYFIGISGFPLYWLLKNLYHLIIFYILNGLVYFLGTYYKSNCKKCTYTRCIAHPLNKS